ALHLDDLVPAGGRAGDADGVHRGLGAGVHEPHLLQLEAFADGLGQGDRVGSGDGEVDRVLGGFLERLDDLRMRVAHDVDTEAAVEGAVLRPVDLPDVGALASLQVDRVRVSGLEVGGHPAGQALQ